MNSKKPVPTTTKTTQPAKPTQQTLSKPTTKPTTIPSNPVKPSVATTNAMKPIQNIKPVPKKQVWTNKKGQQYEGAQDYQQPQLEDDTNYFEKQLQKEIETDIKKISKSEQAAKGALPTKCKKEEDDLKNTKVIENEMEKELERMMKEELENAEFN